MRSSINFILFFLLGLVASLALPRRQSQPQFAVVDFASRGVRDKSFFPRVVEQNQLISRTGLPFDPDIVPG